MTDVSIIIPCYNYEKFLPESILSAVEQSVECEVIVVDDGSTDNSEQVVKRYPVKFYKKPREGIAALTRNYGIERSSGKIIITLDADDILKPWFAELAVKLLQDNKDCDAVIGHAEVFGDSSGIIRAHQLSETLKVGNNIPYCSAIRRTVFDKIGLFKKDMPTQGLEDWEFWFRMYKHGYKVIVVDEPIFKYRKHGGSCSQIRTDENWKKLERFFEDEKNK